MTCWSPGPLGWSEPRVARAGPRFDRSRLPADGVEALFDMVRSVRGDEGSAAYVDPLLVSWIRASGLSGHSRRRRRRTAGPRTLAHSLRAAVVRSNDCARRLIGLDSRFRSVCSAAVTHGRQDARRALQEAPVKNTYETQRGQTSPEATLGIPPKVTRRLQQTMRSSKSALDAVRSVRAPARATNQMCRGRTSDRQARDRVDAFTHPRGPRGEGSDERLVGFSQRGDPRAATHRR